MAATSSSAPPGPPSALPPPAFRKPLQRPAAVNDVKNPYSGQVALPRRPFTNSEIKEAFDAFDLDHNKYVGAAEIRHVLRLIGEQCTDEEIDEMIRMCDSDGAGQVTFDEFLRVMSMPFRDPQEHDRREKVQPRKAPAPVRMDAGMDIARATAPGQLDRLMAELNGGKKMKASMLKKVYKKFNQVDKDGSGRIDYDEFLQVMGQPDSPLMKQLFVNFDIDRSGSIELKEFVVVLSKFTNATKTDKLKFAFMMFDEDGSGYIERNELKKILMSNFVSEGVTEVMLEQKCDLVFQTLGVTRGRLSYDDFMRLSNEQPGLLFPVTSVSHTLGDKLSIDARVKQQKDEGGEVAAA